MSTFPKLRSDLVASPMEVDNEAVVIVKDPITGRFFKLREPEYWLISQLDGERSPEQVAEAFRARFDLNISADNVRSFITLLESNFFLDDSRSEQEISRAGRKSARAGSLFGRLLFIRVKAFTPGRFLTRLTSWYRQVHNGRAWALQAAVVLLGFYVIAKYPKTFAAVNPAEIFSIGSVSAIVVSLFVIIFFHEFAHAVVCRHYGGQVREMGFLLMYFQPCFYCDVSDAWLFPKKRQRMAVTLAGPWFQLVLTALAAILWRLTVPGTLINEIARLIALVSLVSYLFNFNPLIKLDGYYLLSDYLEIPNLRSRAFAYFDNVLKRRLLGWAIPAIDVRPRERKIFLTYAILALTYSGFLIGFVLFWTGRWLIGSYGGAGLLLLVVTLFLILRRNIASLGRGLLTHLRHMKNLFTQPLRLGIYIVVTITVVVALFFIPVPDRVSGEIVVRPIAEFNILMNEFGMIERSIRQGGATPDQRVSILQVNSSEMGVLDLVPTVNDGQVVAEGDTLAVLASNQTTQEIESAEAELQRLEGTLALLRAPPKREEVLEAESRVTSAKANFDKKKSDYERAKGLADKNLISAQEIDNANSEMEIALADWRTEQSALDLLKSPPRPEEETVLVRSIQKQRARLGFLRSQVDAQSILAPFSGVVARNSNQEAVLSVINHRRVELLVPVNDFDITRVQIKQLVTIKVRSYPGQVFKGLVIRIPETASEIDGDQFYEVAVLVDNSDGLLRDGMTGYAKIEIGNASIARLISRAVLSRVRVEFWSWW